jgi:Protein of unknown function (DUF1329)
LHTGRCWCEPEIGLKMDIPEILASRSQVSYNLVLYNNLHNLGKEDRQHVCPDLPVLLHAIRIGADIRPGESALGHPPPTSHPGDIVVKFPSLLSTERETSILHSSGLVVIAAAKARITAPAYFPDIVYLATIHVLFAIFLLAIPLTALGAQQKPLSEEDLVALLRGGVFAQRVARLVEARGITFIPDDSSFADLKKAGASKILLRAVKKAKRHISFSPAAVSAKSHLFLPQISASPAGLDKPREAQVARITEAPTKSLLTGSSSLPAAIAPGTTIRLSNWRLYRMYMPFGMARLFEGRDFWHMPSDVELVIGPATVETLPKGYVQATRRYSKDVRVVHLPDGHNDIRNYVGGVPFPHPKEPDKGYKLLADLWFAYVPHVAAGTSANPLRTCTQDAIGSIKCLKLLYVYRQLAYNTDPGVPMQEPDPSGSWYSEWTAVEEPEQLKYTAQLRLFYKDNQRSEELYTYVPQLRTSIRASAAARCSPVVGTDYLQDDYKSTGFNGGIARFDAEFLGHQKILAIFGRYKPLAGGFPRDYYMPLGWPAPTWATWQLRDVDVIAVRPVASERLGYCYPLRVIYEDSETHYALWEDAYDTSMQLWKSAFVAQRFVDVTGLGSAPGGVTSTVWDFQNLHMTNVSTEDEMGHDLLADVDIPKRYLDVASFATPAGLRETLK